jgi:predicted PurR-regulated permease PerM
VVLAAVAAALVVWRLSDVILLAFGAVLVAILLHAVAEPLIRRVRMSRRNALLVAVLVLAAAIGATLWLFGQQIGQQMAALGELVPRTWAALKTRLLASPLGAYLLQDLQTFQRPDGALVSWGSRLIGQWAAAAAAAVIVLFTGLYLAFNPQTYLGGLIRLAPIRHRARMREVLEACGTALNRWLVGQLISMVLVGVSVGIGLWFVGVPSPFALGVLAGLGQFVPVVGPMAATLPGLVVAAGQDVETLVWAGVVYLAAAQFEANVFTPLILRQMVELPMAVTLFAVLAMGVLLGPLGVLFATPLAVLAYVVVRMLYVEGVLGDVADSSS